MVTVGGRYRISILDLVIPAGMGRRVLLWVLLSTQVLSNPQEKAFTSGKAPDKVDDATSTGEVDEETCSVSGEEVGEQQYIRDPITAIASYVPHVLATSFREVRCIQVDQRPCRVSPNRTWLTPI